MLINSKKLIDFFTINRLILLLIIVYLLSPNNASLDQHQSNRRTFEVDQLNKCFLKDGRPFRYVSGSIHYFRVPKPFWFDRLRKMKYGGLNAIQTYVEWSSHEPEPGQYRFDHDLDLIEFIRLANELDLLVVLRVGPYICAERDMGGYPSWLLNIPNIKIRTDDPKYLEQVERWLSVLLPKIRPFLYRNGGPIIMVQIENEYGSYGCNGNYTTHLRTIFDKYLRDEVVLFTTDGNGDGYLRCGPIPNILATIDFGSKTNVSHAIETFRKHRHLGPLVNSEYYSGWLDYWEEKFIRIGSDQVIETFDEMLHNNFSVNIYMYHGGTNFDLKSGSNMAEKIFRPMLTSYDYDAPINEAGDLTEKFFAIKSIITKHFGSESLPHDEFLSISNVTNKMSISSIQMSFVGTIFDYKPEPIISRFPLTFEQLKLDYGFILYESEIILNPSSPSILEIVDLRDRAHIFVDYEMVGILSRTRKQYTLPLMINRGSKLSILVENQGRCSFQCFNQTKGIVGNVTINHHIVENWKIFPIYRDWNKLLERLKQNYSKTFSLNRSMSLPSFYVGDFYLPNRTEYPLDSFLKLDLWRKGIAFLNGHNLGRYWPAAGPQITLYTPSIFFKPIGIKNRLVLFELDGNLCRRNDRGNEANSFCDAQFIDHHILNGTIPD
ncbi:Beta-galactosidase [Sarcoptes scabiei]|uniref:Beta-galactosidase n=1 Tax=Sarcoptes scabiei TaxID=52283 RepID=A0A834VHW3_SARSC|nr:Beta-galactosidase [Sarcoptes scabiei]